MVQLHFLNPNFHVILIHYPLGVFMLGLFIELFSFLWLESSARTAARWMILLGGLATLPAATSGIYALSQVLDPSSPALTARGVHMLRMHVWLQSLATLLAVFTAVFSLAASDGWRRRFRWVAMGVFAGCAGLMVVGSWFAGESVYTQAVGIHLPNADDAKATAFSPLATKQGEDKLIYFTGEPLQLHMISAGVMFAISMAALGLAIRAITSEYPDSAHFPLNPHTLPNDSSGPLPLVGESQASESPAPRFASHPMDPLAPLPVPAARFWLIAALLALVTAFLGYWLWQTNSTSWSFDHFWRDEVYGKKLKLDRSAIHVWLAISLIVLPLILAILARWAARQTVLLSIFAVLLVLVIAFQVWLGVLLTFDGGDGSLFHFSASPTPSASMAATPSET